MRLRSVKLFLTQSPHFFKVGDTYNGLWDLPNGVTAWRITKLKRETPTRAEGAVEGLIPCYSVWGKPLKRRTGQ